MEQAPSSAHYDKCVIEPIEYIIANGWWREFCKGNILKYISRYEHKDGIKDLEKAKYYIELLLTLETEQLVLQEEK